MNTTPPESNPAVTDELVRTSVIEFFKNGGEKLTTSHLAIRNVLSHAFSQVLPGIQSELQKVRAEIASMEAEMVKCLAIVNAASPVKGGDSLSAAIADLTTKLAYAEDAASKGDLARQNAGAMEIQIAELQSWKSEAEGELVKNGMTMADLTRRLEEEKKRTASLEVVRADLCRNLVKAGATGTTAGELVLDIICDRDAHKARADKAEGELATKKTELENAWAKQESTIKEWNREIDYRRSVCEERDQAHRELDSLQWVSLDVRKPTAEDADEFGDVDWYTIEGKPTHWRRTNRPRDPKVEPTEREVFNKWCEDTGVLRNVAKIYARSLFDKAREGKV